MTTDRAPVEIPEEMVRAGAKALCDAQGYPTGPHNVDLQLAEGVIRAALRVVLSDPCPTCSARWGEPPPARKAKGSGTCPDEFHNRPAPPVWAWLRVAQDAWMLEAAAYEYPDGFCSSGYAGYLAREHGGTPSPLFRFVAPTEEPT